MSYTLKVELQGMSRKEASAIIRAILDEYGASLVEEEIKRREAEKAPVVRNGNVVREPSENFVVGQ